MVCSSTRVEDTRVEGVAISLDARRRRAVESVATSAPRVEAPSNVRAARRSGPIRPMNVPMASARFSGSSRNAATASRGPRSMRSLEGARARSRATPAVKKSTDHANELTKMMAEPLEAQSKALS